MKEVSVWNEIATPTAKCKDVFGWWPEDGDLQMTWWAYFLEGLGYWQAVGIKECWLTTDADSYKFFTKEGLPRGTHLGLKTSSFLSSVEDRMGWQWLAAICTMLLDRGQDFVVLDNEGLLKPIFTGRQAPPHPGNVIEALAPCRNLGASVFWNLPNIQRESHEKWTEDMTLAFAYAVPGSMFLVAYDSRPRHLVDADVRRRRRKMTELVGEERIIDRAFVAPNGTDEYWTPAQAIAYSMQKELAFNLWAGNENWLTCAKTLAEPWSMT